MRAPAARVTLGDMRSVVALLAALPVLLAGGPAIAAPGDTVDVPRALGRTLDRVVARTSVDVLVPSRLELDADVRIHPSGRGDRRGYVLSLAGAPDCGGATACTLATFTARRGASPSFGRRVRLRGGIPGWFKPLTCGASCSPPAIEFRRRGVLHTIQARVPDATDAGQRRRLVRAANSALAAGPR